ncbi:MAG: sensor histidine kinase [Ichthyobacteriaceae bacterium]|nr:sensor histidine kinase [Ichthyobacteriaceae bacterium]
MKELSLHILDIAMNSVKAQATELKIYIEENIKLDLLKIIIIDNGVGMTEDELVKVVDPFFTKRTTRKVGLGIPLFKANAECCGGCFSIDSTKNVGTIMKVEFQLSHIDRPIMGDIATVISMLCTSHPDINTIFKYDLNSDEFLITSEMIKDELGGVSIQDPEVGLLLKDIINNGIESLKQ